MPIHTFYTQEIFQEPKNTRYNQTSRIQRKAVKKKENLSNHSIK